ncbi:MAG: flagellar M-ring protein FliF [Sphingomonadales bacterium]|nr:flagellar M-ring protein FliF [Sphingomonadales bacterium]
MAEDTSYPAADRSQRQIALIAGGALALALVLFAIWYFIIRTPMAPAFSGLKPADASLIVDELKRQKTPYELTDDGATILVPSTAVDAARIGILGGDLPLKGTVGFELFSKSDMGLTEFAQKINYQRALQGELARTLMSMSTIDTARVHITLPESGVFKDDHRPAKASVTITPRIGASVDGRSIIGIQRLVASAVDELDAANVVVLDSSGRQLSADMPMAESAPVNGANGGAIEQAYAAQVRATAMQLVNDPGMRVTVWAPADAAVQPQGEGPAASARAKRQFPLRITLALATTPGPDLHDRLAALLVGAIGYDPALGDSLTLVRLPAPMPYDVGTPIAAATGAPAKTADWQAGASGLGSLGWLAALACLALLLAVLAGRRLRHRAMTPAARDSFAARLRELLDEDERLRGGRA